MIHVIAIVTAQPGQRAAILKAFRANMPAVLAEAGCIEYVPVVDAADGPASQSPLGPDTFMVIEKWADMAALAAHSRAPHMAAYGAKVASLLAGRAVHVLTVA